ncbi:lachrymatory-factor synthase-like [Tasmannia lanceolata]|uniref:lachrymatory-factor synthase-like n=1 Tax=Tasmannia lanceolata TaxID=3420 RepID=UPI00406380CB
MEHEQEPKGEGKAIIKLKGPSADQIWALLSDFFNLNKWLPGIDKCNRVEGVSGEPGCIRYLAGTIIPPPDGDSVSWANEKLLSIDPMGRTYTYEMLENNMGYGSYVGTMRVVSNSDDGCMIEWSFVGDPVKGWSQDVFVSYCELKLQTIAKKMEEAIQVGH